MKKKSPLKKLKTQCEILWKLCCKKRDGNKCSLCASVLVLQVDHCFSRTCGELFLDIRNGTTLCSGCHTQKTFKNGRVDRKVDELVIMREGSTAWNEIKAIYLKNSPYDWSFHKLELKKKELEDYLKQ